MYLYMCIQICIHIYKYIYINIYKYIYIYNKANDGEKVKVNAVQDFFSSAKFL